jgi:hypothetical protein
MAGSIARLLGPILMRLGQMGKFIDIFVNLILAENRGKILPYLRLEIIHINLIKKLI